MAKYLISSYYNILVFTNDYKKLEIHQRKIYKYKYL